MLAATTRDLIINIAAGKYTNDELTAFLEVVKSLDMPSFKEAYQLLYEEVNKYTCYRSFKEIWSFQAYSAVEFCTKFRANCAKFRANDPGSIPFSM